MVRFKYLALVLLAGSCVAAAPASAATTIGDHCPVTGGLPGYIGFNAETGAEEAITDNGVITEWGVNVPFPIDSLPISLLVGRASPGPSGTVLTITGVSETQLLAQGDLTFKTRLPVAPGALLGTGFTTLYCDDSGERFVYGALDGAPVVGATAEDGTEVMHTRSGAWATVEPDVDLDGYGDETQDDCPELPETFTPCPHLAIDAIQVPYASGFRALVASGFPTTLRATATMKLPGKGTGKSKTRTVKGNFVTCQQDAVCAVKVNWPRALKTARKALGKNKSINVSVSVVATFAGQSETESFKIKLPGLKGRN